MALGVAAALRCPAGAAPCMGCRCCRDRGAVAGLVLLPSNERCGAAPHEDESKRIALVSERSRERTRSCSMAIP